MNLEELKQRVEKNTAGCESLPSELKELEAKLLDEKLKKEDPRKAQMKFREMAKKLREMNRAAAPAAAK